MLHSHSLYRSVNLGKLSITDLQVLLHLSFLLDLWTLLLDKYWFTRPEIGPPDIQGLFIKSPISGLLNKNKKEKGSWTGDETGNAL